MKWPKNLLFLSVHLILVSTAVWGQQGRDATELTIEACLSNDLTVEGVEQRLASLGWMIVQTDQLSDEQLRSWAAFRLIEEMRFGAKSEARWREAWGRAQKNASGLKRLVASSDLPTKKLHFGHSDGRDLLEVQVQNFTVSDEVYCNLVVPQELAPTSLTPVFETRLTQEMPAIVPLRPQVLSSENPKISFFINMLRKDAISDLLGEEFDFIASISTMHTLAK